MTLVALTGVTVTEDESTGVQNSGAPVLQNGLVVEDNNDNDIALSNLSSLPFYSEVFGAGGLNLNPASVIGLAKSPANVISIGAGAGLTDVAFTDSSGNPLVGAPSGLTTTGGAPIYLYTDTVNDIVVGRVGTSGGADPNGQVAFVVVMDETSSGGVVTGANFWIVQFDSLHNPIAGGPTDGSTATTSGAFDDPVDLSHMLFVTVDQQLLFSDFSKAPSGQNDWLGIAPTGSTYDTEILVTGMHLYDAGNNAGGDTVNTSTTGIGTDSQAVNMGQGIRIDFVSGLNTGGDTKNMEAINYAAHHQVHGAGFAVTQVQGAPTTRVDARVTIMETGDATTTSFVSGITSNTAVPITYVTVLDTHGNVIEQQNSDGTNPINDPNISITISGNTATVHGLLNGYSVVAHSGGVAFDRMTVENVTNASSGHSFDVGGISLLDAASQTADVGGAVRFEDSGPSVSVSLVTGGEVRVSEHGLETASSVSTTVSAASLFSSTINYNADGPATSGAVSWSFSLSAAGADSGLKDSATGHDVLLYMESGQIVGRIDSSSGAEVFSVGIDSTTGAVTLTQYRAIVNPDPTDPVESLHPQTIAPGLISVVETVTDGDGDIATATADPGPLLKFQDDGPHNITPDGATLTDAPGGADTESLNSTGAMGADAPGTITFQGTDGSTLSGSVNGGSSTGLTSGHQPIYLFGFGTGVLTGTTDPTNTNTADKVFTVTLDQTGGTYSVNMIGTIDNGESLIFNNFSGVPSGQQQWIGLLDPRSGAANEHQDVLFTGLNPGVDTVNTSQTGLGSDNQSVDPGEAIRIDFVTNLDVGAGNLKNLSTVAFDGHYTVNHAGFEVSQTQSHAGVATRISVYDETGPAPDLNPATPYSASDLTNDPKKVITEVTVLDSSGNVLYQATADGSGSGITVHFLNGGTDVDVIGLKAGETVLADTADGFQRMQVQNVGSTYHISKGFDLGGVVVNEAVTGNPVTFSLPLQLTDNDGDTASGAINVTLDPSTPSPFAVTANSTITSAIRGVEPTSHGTSPEGFLLHDGFALDTSGHSAFGASEANPLQHQAGLAVLHDSLFF